MQQMFQHSLHSRFGEQDNDIFLIFMEYPVYNLYDVHLFKNIRNNLF